jgi:excisionase family DNA binding protein
MRRGGDMKARRTKPQGSISSPSEDSTHAKHLELPELLTVDEVAAWLKTSRKAIYAKAERGAIPGATHIGCRLYFYRSDLLRWVEQGRVPDMEK